MNAPDFSIIGCRVSIISKAKIRYEGNLHSIDFDTPNEPVITLSKVWSFGTEDRQCERPVAPRNEEYNQVVFRGRDLDDVRVVQSSVFLNEDSAIVSAAPGSALSHPPGMPPHEGRGRAVGETTNFSGEYDYERANAELAAELEKICISSKAGSSNASVDNTENDGSSATGDENACYDKSKSFFDTISSEMMDRANGVNPQGMNRRDERLLNSATFGAIPQQYPRRMSYNQRSFGYGQRRGSLKILSSVSAKGKEFPVSANATLQRCSFLHRAIWVGFISVSSRVLFALSEKAWKWYTRRVRILSSLQQSTATPSSSTADKSTGEKNEIEIVNKEVDKISDTEVIEIWKETTYTKLNESDCKETYEKMKVVINRKTMEETKANDDKSITDAFSKSWSERRQERRKRYKEKKSGHHLSDSSDNQPDYYILDTHNMCGQKNPIQVTNLDDIDDKEIAVSMDYSDSLDVA
ncbi:unnamed protein product [Heterobilharzia americana]|nr:unnamed protein product [Heterobilharzia americana]